MQVQMQLQQVQMQVHMQEHVQVQKQQTFIADSTTVRRGGAEHSFVSSHSSVHARFRKSATIAQSSLCPGLRDSACLINGGCSAIFTSRTAFSALLVGGLTRVVCVWLLS